MKKYVNYQKYGEKGFESFQQAFIDSVSKDDIEVIRLLAPIAEQLYNKKFPKMHGQSETQKEKPKFTLKVLLDKITPIIDKILPANKKEQISDKTAEQPTVVTTANLSFAEGKEQAREVAKNISATVFLKLEELEREERIYEGRSKEENLIDIKEKRIIEDTQEIERLNKEIAKLQSIRTDAWRIPSLQDSIKRRKEWIKESENSIISCKEKIASGKIATEVTSYIPYIDSINIVPEYTAEDAISLIHETGHAASRNYLTAGNAHETLLNELPSITSEFIADKKLSEIGLGDEHRAVKRILDMHHYDANTIINIKTVFDEYEKTGSISHETVDNALFYGLQVDARKQPDEYKADDVNHIRTMIKSIRYFTGTAAALALRETVKSKADLDRVFAVLNDTQLTDSQRLTQMGVTQENIISSLNAFVQQNRAQTVDKMLEPILTATVKNSTHLI